MISISQSADESRSPTDHGDMDEAPNMPVLKYSYNKNKAKKPRRNKSAFILFSIEKRAEIRAKNKEGMNSNEMMVKLADLWKNLPKNEKDRYELEARNDKIRYHQELETFWKENPSEVLENKTKKNHVKKPCSAYAIFLKELKEEIKGKEPKLKMADVLKIVSAKWKSLDKAEKAVYQQRAEKEKEISKMKLGENYIKGEARSESVLRKKKARQQNEIRKQIKAEMSAQALSTQIFTSEPVNVAPGTTSPPQIQAIPVLPNAPQKVFETIFFPDTHSLETVQDENRGFSNRNEFTAPLPSRFFELPALEPFSVPPLEPLTLSHLNNAKQPSEPPLQNQKSMLTVTTNLFPEKTKDDEANDFLKFLNRSVLTNNNELILDLLNFDSNPGRLDSLGMFGKSSLRLNSNPFASTMDLTNQPFKSHAPRASRADILNNAILGALEHQDSKREDDYSNNRYFDLSLFK